MRFFSLFIVLLFGLAAGWETDFEEAKEKAEKEHKYILLNFSGSDWCGPCIKMHEEIFEKVSFKNFADSSLVLVNADFPRLKKNQLSKDQQKKNDKLADKYDADGIFPLTLLLNAEGKVLKTWEGYPSMTAEQFVDQLKSLCNDRP
ncbi:MAG: thioredoxin family protein [Chitinophagaceae bacterium]|nr:thioredoxin family protein [Chitinophagaceae bacterium]